MRIRAAAPEDWNGIEALLTSCALPLEGARENLAHFLVRDEGGIVGCAGAEVYGEAALLRSLAVVPARRGDGIGNLLCDAVIESLREHGVKDLVLLTTTAEGFFVSRGFRTVPREQVPEAVRGSREFTGACPDSAVAMMRRLSR